MTYLPSSDLCVGIVHGRSTAVRVDGKEGIALYVFDGGQFIWNAELFQDDGHLPGIRALFEQSADTLVSMDWDQKTARMPG